MDKDIIVLMVGILIIGLAGGFIINFFVYQPQIQSLKKEIAALEDELSSQFAENEKILSDLNNTISNLKAAIAKLNATSETSENETETYENLMVQAQATSNGTHFEINFGIINSGTANATLTSIYLYQFPIYTIPDVTSLVVNGMVFPDKTFTLFLPVGASVGGTMTIIESDEGFHSGTYLEFRVMSAKGYSYTTAVYLP